MDDLVNTNLNLHIHNCKKLQVTLDASDSRCRWKHLVTQLHIYKFVTVQVHRCRWKHLHISSLYIPYRHNIVMWFVVGEPFPHETQVGPQKAAINWDLVCRWWTLPARNACRFWKTTMKLWFFAIWFDLGEPIPHEMCIDPCQIWRPLKDLITPWARLDDFRTILICFDPADPRILQQTGYHSIILNLFQSDGFRETDWWGHTKNTKTPSAIFNESRMTLKLQTVCM